jgi:transcriptional regulator with XRE-family HTH domain
VDAVKEIRRRKGWSQKDLANESGVGQDTISGIESGRHEPRPSTLRKLADALGVEVADFFREPAVPLAQAPKGAGPPRVSRERLQEHFDGVRQDEVDYLNFTIADLWRLALPGEKPQAHFVPENIDAARVWGFLEHAFDAGNVFEPEQAERINRGARKAALAGKG